MRWIAFILVVISLGLNGCGSPPETKSTSASSGAATKMDRNLDSKNSNSGAADDLIDPPAKLIAESGVDAYPGAKVLRGASAVRGGAEDDFLDVVYFTNDDGKKVFEFYRMRLLEPEVIGENLQKSGVYCIDGKNAAGDEMRIQAHTINGKTNIHVIRRPKK